jgi:hypothetical protein
MATKIIAGYKKPTNIQVIRLHEGMVILGASLGCDALKKGRTKVVVDGCGIQGNGRDCEADQEGASEM